METESKRRKYPHGDDLNGSSVEDWCKVQIGWLKKRVNACKGDKKMDRMLNKCINNALKVMNETNAVPFPIQEMRIARERVPITMDTKAVILCSTHVDRIGVAVMISYILWYDARQRGTNAVTFEDAKRLFWCITVEDDWREAWESQKFVNDNNRGALENMLDYAKVESEE